MNRNKKKILKSLKEIAESHPEWRLGWVLTQCLPSGKTTLNVSDFDLANALAVWSKRWNTEK